MRARLRNAFLTALGTFVVVGMAAAPSVSVSANTSSGAGRLAFEVTEGLNLNSFLRVGPVAAHLLLRAGTEPRIVVAFPAGNSGAGLWFAATREPMTWRLDKPPQPITRQDAKGRPLYGIVTQATATAPYLSVKQVLLSSVRVLRDYQTIGVIPPEITTAPDEQRQTLTWKRDRLDGAAGYRLSLEVTHGELKDGRIEAARDGKIGMTVTALSGDKPLTPLPTAELLDDPAHIDRSARNVLTFLSYREKFLAGSWRYNTYFGRDTLMSLRLLMPALSPNAVEDGLGSVLSRLSSTGEVAHEEEIGEFAVLDHLRANGSLSDAPVFDYKMIDGSFMLAPTAGAWLFDDPRAASRAAAFLARKDGGYGRAPRTFGADLISNLRFVIQRARAFAEHPQAANLVSLKAGFPWGQWRDSDDGIAQGRYPYDVNAVFIPAALEAAGRFYESGLLAPYMNGDDRAALSQAAAMADIWRAKAGDLFLVDVHNANARSRIEAYALSAGVPPDAAIRSIGTSAVQFHALALDVDARPIPIINSDEGFELLFGSPGIRSIETAIDSVMRPFPAGLLTDVGVVVANPVFATPEIQARFSKSAYHGTVIWSWQQAVLAAGLARQIERRDLPDSLKERMRGAQKQLWRVIERGRDVINSELWSWAYRDGHYEVAPFGAGRTDADESNAAQLWSTVYIAIHAPTLGAIPGATPVATRGMVETPCPEMPARPAEIHERTEMDLRPEKPDPAALARPPTTETRAYLAAQDAQHEQDWPNLCRYQSDNSALPRDANIRAVFLGDSITENWRAADPAFFSRGTVNRGIGGQTSPQMLVRFYADVVALHPRVVHIMAGTNDLAGNTGPTSPQQFKNNIMAMCDLAVANGVRVVLASIPPTTSFPWRAELRPGPQVVELNSWLRHYAAQRKIIYVDYHTVLADADGAMRADLSHDGVHPHRAGYALMEPLAERAIAAALKQR